MEDQNAEEPKKPWDNSIQYEYDAARRREAIFKATLEYLRTNEKVQNYLAQFNQDTIDSTLRSYAWQKARWIANKDYDEYWDDHSKLEDKNKAEECLSNIQQKKLFDKQCEWRAEQFTHPSIEVVNDFKYWEYNVLNCPFLDPITPEDIELYLEFLDVYFGENLPFVGHWQDYDTYCTDRVTVTRVANQPEEDEDDEDEDDEEDDNDVDFFNEEEEEDEEDGSLMPPWYTFWNERRGAGNYQLLTDVRRPKEQVYFRLGFEEEQNAAREQFKMNPPDTRKFLNLYGKDNLVPFINEYEDPAQVSEILQAYEVNQRVWWDKEEEETMYWVKDAWHNLRDCFEPFPVAQGITDWKEALVQTAKNWEHHKLKRLIPIVYDEYLFRMEVGIEHPYDHEQADHYRQFADRSKANILRGRELMGEPRDFDF